MPGDPLVVTLRCGGPGWRICEGLREAHFPRPRNIVPAHIAMFHHLPGEELARVSLEASEIAGALPEFSPRLSRFRSLGRGVALVVESPELLQLHHALSNRWKDWLIPQDRVRFSPHVTIQNKVAASEARSLVESLERTFLPFSVEALGVEVWHYRNGPWERAGFAAFRPATF